MAKPANKMSRTFRLSRNVIALMETYARENEITNTEVVEIAIKRLCRESQKPATQHDIEELRNMLTASHIATLNAIREQPVAALATTQEEKRGLWRRLVDAVKDA